MINAWAPPLLPTFVYLINRLKSSFLSLQFYKKNYNSPWAPTINMKRMFYCTQMPTKDPPVHKGKGCCPKNCFPTSSIKKYLAFSRPLIYLQFGTWGLAFAALMPLETPLSDTFSCIPSAATQHHKRLSAIY